MKQQSLVNTRDISPEIALVDTDYREKEQCKRGLEKEILKDQRQVCLM